METLTTIIGPPKSLNTRCLSVSRQLKKFLSIQIGNSIEQQKAKSFTTMLWPENHSGNCQMRSRSTDWSWKRSEGRIERKVAFNKNKSFLKHKSSNVSLWHSSSKNSSGSAPNGTPASNCAKMMTAGNCLKSAIKRSTILNTLPNWRKQVTRKRGLKLRSAKTSFWRC